MPECVHFFLSWFKLWLRLIIHIVWDTLRSFIRIKMLLNFKLISEEERVTERKKVVFGTAKSTVNNKWHGRIVALICWLLHQDCPTPVPHTAEAKDADRCLNSSCRSPSCCVGSLAPPPCRPGSHHTEHAAPPALLPPTPSHVLPSFSHTCLFQIWGLSIATNKWHCHKHTYGNVPIYLCQTLKPLASTSSLKYLHWWHLHCVDT